MNPNDAPHDGKLPCRASATGIAVDQVLGLFVQAVNTTRVADEAAALAVQDDAFGMALSEMLVARLFIQDPDHILGSNATKHGEIAEVVEISITRARDALHLRPPSATDASSRTAPEDYRIDGKDVQSKYYNGANNTLGAVNEHMDTYTNFGRDGSFYHISKDQYEHIMRVLAGDTEGMSRKSVDAIREKVKNIEEKAGKPFGEVVQPASTEYREVQLGKVEDTLDKLDEDLARENEKLKDDIRIEHSPSVAEGLKVAASAAVVTAAFGFVTSSAQKYFKADKNIFRGDFTRKDWQEVGLDTLKAGATGGVTAGAVYALTNYAEVPAPFAASCVSAAKGVGSLVVSYQQGEISADQLIDEAFLVCSDFAVVGLFSVAGQALIPIPALGALIGTFAGKAVSELLADKIGDVSVRIEERLNTFRSLLAQEERQSLDALKSKYLPHEALTELAFDVKQNLVILEASVAVARLHGVPEQLILKNDDDVLAFLRAAPLDTPSARLGSAAAC